jgi:hypothetical protein
VIAAWVTAIVLAAVASLLGVGLVRAIASNRSLPRTTPSAEIRFREYQRLLSTFPGTPNAEVATFLLDESKRHYHDLLEAGKSIETQATTLLGLAAGGSSAVVVFGLPKDGKVAVTTAPVAIGLGLALCAFMALLFVLRVKIRREPNVASFLSAPIAFEEANRARIAMSLAEDFESACYGVMWNHRRDVQGMYAAYVCLTAAVLLISANAVLLGTGHH